MTDIERLMNDFKLGIKVECRLEYRPFTGTGFVKLIADSFLGIPELCVIVYTDVDGVVARHFELDEIRKFEQLGEMEYLKIFNETKYGQLLKYKQNIASLEPLDRDILRAVNDQIAIFLAWFTSNGFEIPEITDKSPVGSFPPLPGLRWDEVTMTFVSNDSIKIAAGDISKTYTFAEMGFKDGRKAQPEPDSLWRFFKEGFARRKGILSWDAKDVEAEAKLNLKKDVSEIRKRLKKFMGIQDDPFKPYSKRGGYITRFKLYDITPEESSLGQLDDSML